MLVSGSRDEGELMEVIVACWCFRGEKEENGTNDDGAPRKWKSGVKVIIGDSHGCCEEVGV